jgi:signal recognition particle subunit SRP19
MKRRGGKVLWLASISASVARSRGRIIPRGRAVDKPTLEEIVGALDSLGYKYQVFPDKRHPALWFDESLRGYVVVETGESKRALALKVAEEILRRRGRAGT